MTLLELLEYVKAGGAALAPVFATLWWLERDDRKDSEKELKVLTRESVAAMTKLGIGLDTISVIFKPNGR